MSSRRGSSGRGSGRAVGPVAAAQARAAGEAAAEVVRLEDSVQFAVSALSAIGDSARRLSRYSARVRVLELEVLPAGPYLGVCVRSLHAELVTGHTSRGWPERVTVQVQEIQAMLERAIEVTAAVDIPGELGLPLELVSTVQSGARAGLACVDRLRTILDSCDPSNWPGELRREVDELQPSPSAQWLVHTASRLLPPGSRDRYREEFAGELHALAAADASSRAQLGHAVRQVATIWALRRALPSAVRTPSGVRGRVRAPLGTDHGADRDTMAQPLLRDRLREALDRWLARRQAREVLREQVRIQYDNQVRIHYRTEVTRRFPTGRSRHRR